MSHARESRRASRRAEIGQYWQRVTEGLELDQLWKQFAADARESYDFYSREVDWDSIRRRKGWKRPLNGARMLFHAMLMKLPPARRILLLLATALFLYSVPALLVLVFTKGRVENLVLVADAVLLFLLATLELADRVTMKRDLAIAREIQQWLVPEKPPSIAGLDIAFSTRPANTVAGDYYDALLRPDCAQPDRLLLVVADVAGKSVPAALLMATFQASLRTLAALEMPLLEMVAAINRYACSHSLNGRRFTTAFFAELDLATHTLTYVNAGHNAPMLLHARAGVERLEAGGLPLGIALDPKGVDHYASGTATLAPGDLLVVFTDGLTEAENAAGEDYGETRLLDAIAHPAGDSAAETLKGIMTGLESFVGAVRQNDDITALILRIAAP